MAVGVAKGGHVIVVGAGIIGIASAFYLSRAGYAVTVLDPFPPAEGGPSRGNSGQIASSDIFPRAAPGILSTALKMMLHRDRPLRVRGAGMLTMAPWFLRFLASSRPAAFARGQQALVRLCRDSLPDMEEMFQEAGIPTKITRSGVGYMFEADAAFAAAAKVWETKAGLGFPSQIIDRAEVATSLPDISEGFCGGVFGEYWGLVTDPLEISRDIAEAARIAGVAFETARVNGIAVTPKGVKVDSDAASFHGDAVLITTGVQSAKLARQIGDRLPVVTERGYNLTIPNPGVRCAFPLILPERGIAVAELSSGLRIGGGAEFTAPNAPARQRTFRELRRMSSEIFPEINLEGAVEWMGNRPSFSDSVPVISASRHSDRVFYNVGHCHSGLTFSATSAKIITAMIQGRASASDQQMYSIARPGL